MSFELHFGKISVKPEISLKENINPLRGVTLGSTQHGSKIVTSAEYYVNS